MNKSKYLMVLLMSTLTIVVSSCDVGIHLAGANSLSAIIAVLGEYLLAIVSIVLVVVFHLTRSLSVSLLLLSLLGMANIVELPISPFIVLVLGLLLLFSFTVPIKVHKPKVIIDKNVKKFFEKDTGEEKQKGGKEIVINIVVGIFLLLVEYLFLAKQ